MKLLEFRLWILSAFNNVDLIAYIVVILFKLGLDTFIFKDIKIQNLMCIVDSISVFIPN